MAERMGRPVRSAWVDMGSHGSPLPATVPVGQCRNLRQWQQGRGMCAVAVTVAAGLCEECSRCRHIL